ncbi:hypothetical protein HYH03_004993 [Edaphochlamys debaryana]|nr:hypothetical protein HYH03_004993 [Edaphochlamys debaryana]|eukprot:KAG2496988.1 hypothetical protein HYH03_004993 [Edaphochlamys debaryana]
MTKPALLAAGSAAVLTSPTAARLLPTSTRATALVLGLAPATGLGLWYLGVGAAWWGLQGAEARARSLAEEYEAAAKEREGGHGQEQPAATMRSALQRSVLGLGALSRASSQQAAPSGPAASAAPYRPKSSRLSLLASGGLTAAAAAAAAIALGAGSASAAEPAPAASPEPQAQGGRPDDIEPRSTEPTPAPAPTPDPKFRAEACWDTWLSLGPRGMMVTGLGNPYKDLYERYSEGLDRKAEAVALYTPHHNYAKEVQEGRQELRDRAREVAEMAKEAVESCRPVVAPLYDTPAAFVYGMTKPALLAAGSAAILTSPTAVAVLPTSTRATALVLGLAPVTGLGLWYGGMGIGWWALQRIEAGARALAEEYERAASMEREGGQGQGQ